MVGVVGIEPTCLRPEIYSLLSHRWNITPHLVITQFTISSCLCYTGLGPIEPALTQAQGSTRLGLIVATRAVLLLNGNLYGIRTREMSP